MSWESHKGVSEKDTLCLGPMVGAKDDRSKNEKKYPVGPWFEEQRRDNDDDLLLTFDEFTRKTTFHGVRYIFDKSLKLRRYTFVLLSFVAISLTFFSHSNPKWMHMFKKFTCIQFAQF